MMLPARTASLPNFFTPRRLLSLSRPLRDEPPAFLCAMSGYFFGVFLAPPLAGAAFFVDPVSALALLGSAFFAAGLPGAGFSVGVPTTALASCSAAGVSTGSFARAAADLSAPALGAVSALGAVFFCSFWSPIATILRIVCCWRCPFLRR